MYGENTVVKVNYKTRLALAAGMLAMAIGAVSIHAAVTVPSTDVPKTINDQSKVTSTLNWPVNGTVTDANLLVNIRHTWDGDVGISLARPSGVAVTLWNHSGGDCGGSGDNFTNAIINDQGVTPDCTNGAPYTGNVKGAPGGVVNATVMTAFIGPKPLGTWVLIISDDSLGDTGTLLGWSLTLDFAGPLSVELTKPEVK
jgi:subtilisin-like proprotein convertase family protein